MIAWKCRVGLSKQLNPASLDSIDWIDNDRYLTIPTISVNYEDSAVRLVSGETAYSFILNIIGDDASTLYLVPPSTSNDSTKKLLGDLLYWFPSMEIGFPNAYANFFDFTGNGNYHVIHLLNLNRTLSVGDSSAGNVAMRVGKVNSSGSISYDTTGTQLGWRCGCGFYNISGYNIVALYCPVVIGYYQGVDLSDYSKWGQIVFSNSSRSGSDTYTGQYLSISNDIYSKRIIDDLFKDNNIPPDTTIIPPDNPYKPVGPSGPTDPNIPPGTFDDTSDPIPVPPIPTLSAANTGFTRIYNPTLSQVQALARYLWTDQSVIETIWNHIKQYFEDPMQAIIGFNLVPVKVPDAGIEEFALMYIGTGVQMTVAASQFVDVDCGTLKVERYYGSALDQSPYTRIHAFLPYIGTVRLNTDEIMGTTLQVKYRVDVVTGSCVAMILVDGNVLYQYSGHCAINIPISSADFSSYVSSAISVAKTIGMGVAMGAAGVAAGAVGTTAAVQSTGMGATSMAVPSTSLAPIPSGNEVSLANYIPSVGPQPGDFQQTTPTSFTGLSPQNVANTVNAVMGGKPYIEHSGSFTGNSGYLGVRRPYLIIERPNMCLPETYQMLNGFPAMITMELGSCKGFTRVQQVQLTGLYATNSEQDEIHKLLKEGVVF